jgi:hypothetical protein
VVSAWAEEGAGWDGATVVAVGAESPPPALMPMPSTNPAMPVPTASGQRRTFLAGAGGGAGGA